ncbi:hypothetical protein AgCh_028255 [Apium graveolens]
MDFDQRKASTLSVINTPPQNYSDKSPKGSLDVPILPLLNLLNSLSCYYTTSSCSGRISILSTPISTSSPNKKAKGGKWVLISHDPVDPTSVIHILFNPTSVLDEGCELVFRFEPLIVAVECRSVEDGNKLVSVAVSCGFRESGISSVGKRVIVAIRCSIRLEVPLGESGRLLVSEEYVRFLVGIANVKMEANRKRTDLFYEKLVSSGFGGEENGVASEELECTQVKKIEACFSSLTEYREIDDGGSTEVPVNSVSIDQLVVGGEPTERVYLWGHSACEIGNTTKKKVLIFGGFGGTGRHARRNDCLLLDPFSGKLEDFSTQGRPSPRLGHTSSLIGNLMYVIGGRADPSNILNEVWLLNTENSQWKLLECTGTYFPSRHRHAAATVGSKIYAFGGIHSDSIYSSLHVLDTESLEWSEICTQGEQPCPRHSHSMVSYGTKLFIFGGYDGEKALGDLYSFDVLTCLWKKENMAGRTPYARFSHSMFVYKHFIGIIGGCPVRQHYQDLSILDLRDCFWKHVRVNSFGKELIVRSSGSVIADDLVMIGGGASCYAFGTKFSDPMKMSLRPLACLTDTSAQILTKQINYRNEDAQKTKNGFTKSPATVYEKLSNETSGLKLGDEGMNTNGGHQGVVSHFVLQLEKKYAKLGKDLLKKFGWLDLERRVYSLENGLHICFPVTGRFCALYDNQHNAHTADIEPNNPFLLEKTTATVLLPDVTTSSALSYLITCGATKIFDEVVRVKKSSSSPLKMMNDSVTLLINEQGLPAELLEQLPTRWERLGDIVLLPSTSFKDPLWETISDKLWPTVAASLGTQRLARQGRVASTRTRDSSLEMLVGDDGWVSHRENGIIYSFDATKCMFSWGNLSEKLRMAHLDCINEVVVDLFAGIGYFVLPFLVRAKAKMLYACEWNPHAVEALRHNLHANSVADRCVVLEGDNRLTAPKGVADRVCLGLLPASEGSWVTAE